MTTISSLAKGVARALTLALLFVVVAVSGLRAEPDANATSPKTPVAGAYYIEFRVAQIAPRAAVV